MIVPIESLGIPGEAKEAVAFALLGAATLDGFPSNVPSVTGAVRPMVLGSVTGRRKISNEFLPAAWNMPG